MEKQKTKQMQAPVPNQFSIDLKKQIEEAAYQKWIQRGAAPNSAQKDWLEAEEEVMDSLKETRI